MTPQRPSKTEPQILEMPSQKMAAVHAKGAPDKVFAEFLPALMPKSSRLSSDTQ